MTGWRSPERVLSLSPRLVDLHHAAFLDVGDKRLAAPAESVSSDLPHVDDRLLKLAGLAYDADHGVKDGYVIVVKLWAEFVASLEEIDDGLAVLRLD